MHHSAILEDSEYSEIENPYFSDNSSSSALTNKLKKFSIEISRNFDKSDNEGSVYSLRSVGANLKKTHSNLNEPIMEEEEEKEEPKLSKQIISETIKKRRKASLHIESNIINQRFSQHKSLILQNDPIYEEVEECDELFSENNFYSQWEQHKKYLLTQDEQVKLMKEDALSQTGRTKKKPYHNQGKIQSKLKKRHFRGRKRDEQQKGVLESIEEQNHEKDDNPEDEEQWIIIMLL